MIPEPETDRNKLLRLVGTVRRARGYRLYTNDGRRIVDLWQDGGRAILGHRTGGRLTVFKNVVDRGPNVPLPSVFEGRLGSAVSALIPDGLPCRVFSNRESAFAAISRWLGRQVGPTDLSDPVECATLGSAMGDVRLWRPFLTNPRAPLNVTGGRFAVLPVLPTLGDSPPQVVLFAGPDGDLPPESDLVAAYRLAVLIRGIHDLAAAPAPQGASLDGYLSCGPYLFPVDAQCSHERRFEIMLEKGFLVSPNQGTPSIMPAEISSGELAQLTRAASIAVQLESGDGN